MRGGEAGRRELRVTPEEREERTRKWDFFARTRTLLYRSLLKVFI